MKMRRNKKLNRKGFTLIELLAVIVILAVIMVIASTSVLSSMNSSKKSSLADSAKSAKSSFDNKYTEMALVASDKILGLSTDTVINGTAKTALTGVDKAALNINDTDYDLANSFVYFDNTNSTFLVCFVAKNTGSFYVASAAKTEATTINGAPTGTELTGMWACSNGQNSWS